MLHENCTSFDTRNEFISAMINAIRDLNPDLRLCFAERLAGLFEETTGYYLINNGERFTAWNTYLFCITKNYIFIHPDLHVPSMTLDGWETFYQAYKKERK